MGSILGEISERFCSVVLTVFWCVSFSLLPLQEDEMLATYVQMLEQSKATRATAPSYQATPTYNPQPQGHYYYHH